MLAFMMAVFFFMKLVLDPYQEIMVESAKYPFRIRRKSPSPAKEITNIALILLMIFFVIGCIVFYLDGEYLQCVLTGILSVSCMAILCEKNAILIYYDKNSIHIRRHLKYHVLSPGDFTESVHDKKRRKYIISFGAKSFSVPDYFPGIDFLVENLNALKTLFSTREGMDFLKDFIRERTGKSSFILHADFERVAGLRDSKFGGLPYWNPKMEYPKDEDGCGMQLLCQINFSELHEKVDIQPGGEKDLLPKKGILQFFISTDPENLWAIYDDVEQKNWRIVFHDEIDESISEDDVKPLAPDTDCLEWSLLQKTCAINFSEETSYMKPRDFQFDALLKDAAGKLTRDENAVLDAVRCWNYLMNPYADDLFQMLYQSECYILGHPDFAFVDPRESTVTEDSRSFYDTTLLQINFEAADHELFEDDTCSDPMIFLINSEDFARQDFSRVMCC